MHFNLVGHTHDLVDQMFGVFAHLMKHFESLSPQQLVEKFKNAFPGLIQPEFFDKIFAFTDFLKPVSNPMTGQSVPHHFEFKKTWYR